MATFKVLVNVEAEIVLVLLPNDLLVMLSKIFLQPRHFFDFLWALFQNSMPEFGGVLGSSAIVTVFPTPLFFRILSGKRLAVTVSFCASIMVFYSLLEIWPFLFFFLGVYEP